MDTSQTTPLLNLVTWFNFYAANLGVRICVGQSVCADASPAQTGSVVVAFTTLSRI